MLEEFYKRHLEPRRAATVRDIEQGIASGELLACINPETIIDAIFAPVYYRLLLRFAPLTEEFGTQLVDQALFGYRRPKASHLK